MTIESFVDLSHIRRMSAPPEPKQDDLPFPDFEPTDIIEGPRISLRYGSAATEICVSKRLWRRTDRGDRFSFQGRWRSVDDYTDTDCVVGKMIEVLNGWNPPYRGVAGTDDDGFLTIDGRETFLTPSHVRVVPSDEHLNPFEQAIAKVKP